ncbi:hypothetical protein ETAA8_31740 [Anatilimnocola aggregata]|uniref:Uncharacterized protein n=1 Tax=Anatilimnocola aggregata TaxID=2528021 RepID=A0A517YCX5_9BACT|nr:hypothetical protein [Anatilimnocola aggregata]QDU28081.1 hypothetical protein ETAA8_31740 [Anatilimnocola aggregata]
MHHLACPQPRSNHLLGAMLLGLMTFVAAPALSWGSDEAANELQKKASWSPPTTAEVKKQLDDLLNARKADETQKLKVSALWPDDTIVLDPSDVLDRVAASLAVLEPEASAIYHLTQQPAAAAKIPAATILLDESVPLFVRANLRLVVARWLAQNNLIDEALAQLRGLNPADVADPASLLFYQALGQHRLLEKDNCLKNVTLLLENESTIPRRYATIARLMEADIKPLKVDSLDEVARLMDDIRRRLDLGRAGTKVREEEEQVIAKLEKMIEEMEKQQQQQQQQASGSGSGSPMPSSPMQDSQAAELKGPGNVDSKNIGKKDGWGNLPPKERQEVLQQIGRDLPAHFRETIEEYFKRLAQDGVK